MTTKHQQIHYISQCFNRYMKNDITVERKLSELFKRQKISKRVQFLRNDEIWDSFSIIVRGVFRLYYIDEDGKEHTKGVFSEHSILAPCAPSAIGQPVNFTIESFEQTEVLSANYQQVREYLESSDWGAFLLIGLLERILDEKVEREYTWLNLDAESRYLRFVSKNPELSCRLPLYIVANYLGMTDVTLSRIRKKLRLT